MYPNDAWASRELVVSYVPNFNFVCIHTIGLQVTTYSAARLTYKELYMKSSVSRPPYTEVGWTRDGKYLAFVIKLAKKKLLSSPS